MTIDEIKAKMDKDGISIQELADKLSMSRDALSRVLNGKNVMKETLRKHIELILFPARTMMVVYTVDLPDAAVKRLLGADEYKLSAAEKRAALEAVLRHNLVELAKLGSTVACWSDETRAALGLPPNGQPWEPGPEDVGLTAAEDDGSGK